MTCADSLFNVVVFVKISSKKKITKAERLRLLQEEEERRLKEEGTEGSAGPLGYGALARGW